MMFVLIIFWFYSLIYNKTIEYIYIYKVMKLKKLIQSINQIFLFIMILYIELFQFIIFILSNFLLHVKKESLPKKLFLYLSLFLKNPIKLLFMSQ